MNPLFRKYLLVAVLAVLGTGCTTLKAASSEPAPTDDKYDFLPIAPVNYLDVFDFNKLWQASEQPLERRNREVLKFFPNEAAQVRTATVNRSGELNFLPITTSVAGQLYQVQLDYVQYRIDTSPATKLIYMSGVGIRLVADFRSLKSDVRIADFSGLGAAARNEEISGTLRFETLGISGPEISSLIPLPSVISVESIQSAMQASAAIKAKLYDDGVHLWPQIVAVKDLFEKMPNNEVVKLIAPPAETQPQPLQFSDNQ